MSDAAWKITRKGGSFDLAITARSEHRPGTVYQWQGEIEIDESGIQHLENISLIEAGEANGANEKATQKRSISTNTLPTTTIPRSSSPKSPRSAMRTPKKGKAPRGTRKKRTDGRGTGQRGPTPPDRTGRRGNPQRRLIREKNERRCRDIESINDLKLQPNLKHYRCEATGCALVVRNARDAALVQPCKLEGRPIQG